MSYNKKRSNKTLRILSIYTKLINGKTVNRTKDAEFYGVDDRSIQRDIEDFRAYFSGDPDSPGKVLYDRAKKVYFLKSIKDKFLEKDEMLKVAEVLSDSGVFTDDSLYGLMDRMVTCCIAPEEREDVRKLVMVKGMCNPSTDSGKDPDIKREEITDKD